MTRAARGGSGTTADVAEEIVEIFETNPFRKANVVTIRNHLAIRGVERSEPEVRNHCERLVEDGVLAFDQQVYGRATYIYVRD